jgi:uncharacterized protein YjiK
MFGRVTLFVISVLMLFSCRYAEEQKTDVFQDPAFVFKYDLNKANALIKLPGTLREISGIANYTDELLVCVQDEKGIVFVLDKKTGQIQRQIRFAKNGDFEDLERVGSDIWALNSKGDLFEISNFADDKTRNTQQFKTELSSSNDCEGLTYDPKSNCLLIACKASPFLGKKKADAKLKAIYEFDLDNKKLKPDPRFLIHLDSIKKYLEISKMGKIGLKFNSKINPATGDVSFQPSAIALDPGSGDFFVLASVGKLFVVLNADGEIKKVSRLKKNLYPQPEGICFDEDQNLYISSEGKSGQASLVTLNKKK